MKVLVVFTSSYPIGSVSTDRVHNICKGLVENGADVKILITQPTEKIKQINNKEVEGFFEGVCFKYIREKNLRKEYLLLRKIIDIWSHFLVILEVLFNRYKSDVTLVIGPSFDFRLFLPFASIFSISKIFLEINEYPFVAKKQNCLTHIKRWILYNLIYPFYDGFVVISESLLKEVNMAKSIQATVIKVPILGSKVYSDKSKNLSPLNSPYIIHAGSLYEEKDGILGVFEAFGMAVEHIERPLKYVFTGRISNSPHSEEIKKIIANYNLENQIVFTGYLDKKELFRYYKFASLAIVNKYDTRQNRFCFATKFTDYIAHEIPIITTTVGETMQYFINGFNAYLVPPGKSDLMASKIIQAINNPNQMKLIAANASQLIRQDFNYKYQGGRLVKFFEDNYKLS